MMNAHNCTSDETNERQKEKHDELTMRFSLRETQTFLYSIPPSIARLICFGIQKRTQIETQNASCQTIQTISLYEN